MKITFLGTGAADWPIEKDENSQEFRRWTTTVIDDVLLIDPGPRIFKMMEEQNRDPSQIKYIINTHKHGDHYCEKNVERLKALGAEFYEMFDGDVMQIGKYTVKAYAANHNIENAVHFMITDGERTMFYGLDGGWLLYKEYMAIIEHKPDFAILDGTVGFVDGDYRIFVHNNLNMVLEMQKTLKAHVGKFCITHLAKNLHTDHKTLCEAMKPYDIMVAYDGMEINI